MPAAIVAALPLGAAWVAYERRLTARGGAPLVDLALFRVRGFRLGLALALVFYTGLTCVFFLLGLYLQDGLGLAALIAGLALIPVGPGIVVPGIINAVLRSVPAESAGSASGVLSTAQQIGNALGVAGAGAVFFGVLGDGQGAHAYDTAFAIALAWTVVTAAISTLRIVAPERRERARLRALGSAAGRLS